MAHNDWEQIERLTLDEAMEEFDELRPGLDWITLRQWYSESRMMDIELKLFRTAEGDKEYVLEFSEESYFGIFNTLFTERVDTVSDGVELAKQIIMNPEAYAG